MEFSKKREELTIGKCFWGDVFGGVFMKASLNPVGVSHYKLVYLVVADVHRSTNNYFALGVYI